MKKLLVLGILDGFGLSDNVDGNAVKAANTPFLDSLFKEYPNTILKASGEFVGLPAGQMGNSEVGHLNIGAGRVVYTGLSLINNSIENNTFNSNPAFLESINHANKNDSTIHVMGLLSPGGVHSLEEHLWHLLDLLKEKNVKNVTVHPFGDGRDVKPRSILPSLKKLISICDKYNFKIGTISGRLYSMDRDSRFDKTEESFEMLKGKANNTFSDPVQYINDQYAENLTDEFLKPAINSDPNVKFLKDNDSVIFFNFRPDRARQLSHLMVGSKIYQYQPNNPVKNIKLVSMMKYSGITNASVAFDSMKVENSIGEIISKNNLNQLRIAETQKYAHVTFFMDGGVDVQLKGQDRILIDSIKVDNFANAPQMSAEGITNKIIDALDEKDYQLVIMNYANPDMVGHTGDFNAAIESIEFLDTQLKRLKEKIDEKNGVLIITSDHGNAEIMKDEIGNPATKHTNSDVPFIFTDKNIKLKEGKLANISPTILDYLDIEIPKEMDEESLIING
ncbi:MAG: 2,3-bisphosphoglycerate-independent phosphoglycerate mutase [Mycoplasma sp.]|nr:2,3-bisphosphoglycerate-independent phosphoglycerate mutase [Mycoplasma sp.]